MIENKKHLSYIRKMKAFIPLCRLGTDCVTARAISAPIFGRQYIVINQQDPCNGAVFRAKIYDPFDELVFAADADSVD
jgi:hypothetical protein